MSNSGAELVCANYSDAMAHQARYQQGGESVILTIHDADNHADIMAFFATLRGSILAKLTMETRLSDDEYQELVRNLPVTLVEITVTGCPGGPHLILPHHAITLKWQPPVALPVYVIDVAHPKVAHELYLRVWNSPVYPDYNIRYCLPETIWYLLRHVPFCAYERRMHHHVVISAYISALRGYDRAANDAVALCVWVADDRVMTLRDCVKSILRGIPGPVVYARIAAGRAATIDPAADAQRIEQAVLLYSRYHDTHELWRLTRPLIKPEYHYKQPEMSPSECVRMLSALPTLDHPAM